MKWRDCLSNKADDRRANCWVAPNGDWMERRCPVEGCKYEPEGYAISYGYEDKPSKAIYEKAGLEVKAK